MANGKILHKFSSVVCCYTRSCCLSEKQMMVQAALVRRRRRATKKKRRWDDPDEQQIDPGVGKKSKTSSVNERERVKVCEDLAPDSVDDESEFGLGSSECAEPSRGKRETKNTRVYRGRTSALRSSELEEWCSYLLLSADSSKTYVGVTCDLDRRLKQHNGEMHGGAKAAYAGRPWRLACIVHGFGNRSEACQFEWRWKHITRSGSRLIFPSSDSDSLKSSHLLQRRQIAFEKVQSKDARWKRLKVQWHL